MDSKLLGILQSRKFWAAVVSVVFVILEAYVPNFPITEDQVFAIVIALAAYIIGTAIEAGKP